jgi:hypothetical protein
VRADQRGAHRLTGPTAEEQDGDGLRLSLDDVAKLRKGGAVSTRPTRVETCVRGVITENLPFRRQPAVMRAQVARRRHAALARAPPTLP